MGDQHGRVISSMLVHDKESNAAALDMSDSRREFGDASLSLTMNEADAGVPRPHKQTRSVPDI